MQTEGVGFLRNYVLCFVFLRNENNCLVAAAG